MFSPSLNGVPPSASTRTSRRRPRPSSSDSISQPNPKRQRSALTQRTFVPPDGPAEMEEVSSAKTTAALVAKRESERLALTSKRELTVRGKKPKAVERPSKGDGSILLTSNDTYNVSRLPAWPDRLQVDTKDRQHGAIYSDSGYALSITHTHALVWPYAINHVSPETFTFTLPHPSKHTSDLLPLGSLVSSSASSAEPGLVVVMPATGKVTYWESVASAATLDLIQQQRNGVELSIPGMLSGETVIQILNAESAGFVLGFSSGRIAYLSVRDGQGRPAISIQFLRGGSGLVSSGIFGSLRNVLSSAALRGDLAAARAGPSNRPGERTVVTATTKGRLQLWDLHRGGHNILFAETEAREQITHIFQETNQDLPHLLLETFEVLDVVFAPKSLRQNSLSETEDGTPLLLFVSINSHDASHYALIQVKLASESFDIGLVRHLNSYTTPVNRDATSKPRLYLPDPALVAFIVLDRAVVVVSMAQPKATPEMQLLTEGQIIPYHYEDVIDFRKDAGVEIVGSGVEQPYEVHLNMEESKSRRHRSKYPATILLLRGAGVIRIAATDPQKLHSSKPQIVTAKSKLEQAVFFGNRDGNPLSFRGRSEMRFSPEEIAKAALDLSLEITGSQTPYIPALPVMVEQNLRQRADALQRLATHLKTIDAPLDRKTRWELLWNAEKVEAATKVWAKYDARLRTKPEGQKRGLFNDIVLCIHEKWKTEPIEEAGELDRIRHYFIHDIYRFEIAIAWAYQVIKTSHKNGETDHAAIMALVSEADDFIISALGAALKFREHSLAHYGLQNEKLHSGVLVAGYDGLPEFWTSINYVVDNLRRQTDLAKEMVLVYWQTDNDDAEGVPKQQLVEKVRLENPQLVDLCISATTERYRWMIAQEDPKTREDGIAMKELSLKVREVHIEHLAELGLVEDAIDVSVKHKVYNSLASLLIDELLDAAAKVDELKSSHLAETDEYKSASRQMSRVEKRVQDFITQFGAEFAIALYTYYLQRGELHALITDTTGKRAYLTEFLRKNKVLSKLTWINEVKDSHNYDRASQALLDLAQTRERDVWSKRVELSLGKLARMAGKQYSQSGGFIIPDGGNTDLQPTNKQLALLNIQHELFAFVYPKISAAIDQPAEEEIAIETFGDKDRSRLVGTAALPELLEEKLIMLVSQKAMSAVELIDLLTLINTHPTSDQGGYLNDEEFFLALKALKSGPDSKDEREMTEKIIWRRCFLRDDWHEINNTDLKGDEEVQYRLQRTALYATLRACVKNRLFEENSKTYITPTLSPTSILGAGTSPDAFNKRFGQSPSDIKTDIQNDMIAEDTILARYIDSCQLEKWFKGIYEQVKKDVQDEVEREMEKSVLVDECSQELELVERGIADKARLKAMKNLKGKKKLGLGGNIGPGGFRGSTLRIVGA